MINFRKLKRSLHKNKNRIRNMGIGAIIFGIGAINLWAGVIAASGFYSIFIFKEGHVFIGGHPLNQHNPTLRERIYGFLSRPIVNNLIVAACFFAVSLIFITTGTAMFSPIGVIISASIGAFLSWKFAERLVEYSFPKTAYFERLHSELAGNNELYSRTRQEILNIDPKNIPVDFNSNQSRYSKRKTSFLLRGAILRGDVELVKKLIILGADIHGHIDSEESAIQLAINEYILLEVVWRSEDADDDKNIKSRTGQIIRLLIEYGVDVNQHYSFDGIKQTLLHYAVSKGAIWATKLLLSIGADVTKLDQNGNTAISTNLLTDAKWRKVLIDHYAQVRYNIKSEGLNIEDNIISLKEMSAKKLYAELNGKDKTEKIDLNEKFPKELMTYYYKTKTRDEIRKGINTNTYRFYQTYLKLTEKEKEEFIPTPAI